MSFVQKIKSIKILNNFIFFLILIKILSTVYLPLQHNEGRFSAFHQRINPDEYDIANIAYSYNKGIGFQRFVSNADTSYFVKTSYRPFYPIFFHVLYQKIYNKYIAVLKDDDIYDTNTISNYYIIYGQLMLWLSFFLTIISIPFFKTLIESIFNTKNKLFINLLLFLYIIFPSSFLYVGSIPLYENIVLPCLVIMISIIVQFLQEKPRNYFEIYLALLTAFVVSIRPQVIIPVLFIFLYFIFLYLKTYKSSNKRIFKALLYSCIFAGVTICHTLYINYTLWSKITFSTRGDAFLWGHNPLAKGSWDGNFDKHGSEGYIYQLKNIPNILNMDEYTSSKAKSALAIQNIISNPSFEVFLIIKKIAIFFLPYNFESNKFNLIMFLIHLGFILYVFYFFVKFNTENQHYPRVICFVFCLGVLLVNVVYFVEYRVKYFSDPFLLLLSVFIYTMIYNSIKPRFKTL